MDIDVYIEDIVKCLTYVLKLEYGGLVWLSNHVCGPQIFIVEVEVWIMEQ